MELLMIRHGFTPGNLCNQFVGSRNQPLAPEGTALAISRKEEMPPIDALWISPMLRCRQTAQILFPQLEPIQVEELTECNFGAFEGRSWDELENDPVFRAWQAGDPDVTFPEGEKLSHHLERSRSGVARILEQARGMGVERIGIVAHGGTLMAAMSGYAVPHKSYYDWLPRNCGGYLVSVKLDPITFTLIKEV